MRIFHKQLSVLLLVLVILFGGTVYFAMWGMNRSVQLLTEETSAAVVARFRPQIDAELQGLNLYRLSQSQVRNLRKAVRGLDEVSNLIQDFWLVSEDNKILFSLHPSTTDTLYQRTTPAEKGNGINSSASDVQYERTDDHVDAIWKLNGAASLAVLRLNPRAGILRPIFHRVTINFYLIGLGGIVACILLAFVSTRVIKTPLTKVGKSMSIIEKRKYGFRLKWRKDDEFGETYRKVNQALIRMEQLDSAQRKAVHQRNVIGRELNTLKRFLDIMAHEIKNPLHALGLNLDVVKTKIKKGQSKDEALKHTEILEKEVEHLQEVVLGFLNFARPGTPQKERTDINQLIRSVCEMVSTEADRARIKIETRLARSMRKANLDPAQIKQALHNVVINAIHATGEGGKIGIRSWSKRNKVFIEVKDSGSGISKEDLEKIFDLYYTTKKGGSGLGLPVTRRIVEANGGQMQLDSTEGKGTKVTFLFQN